MEDEGQEWRELMGAPLDWPVDWHGRIETNPRVLGGRPVIRGTRLAVEFLLGLFAGGWTEWEVLANYPTLTREDLRAAFAYAAEQMANIAVAGAERRRALSRR